MHLLVDGTGLKLCGAGERLAEKHGAKPRRSWRKSHLATDAGTKWIAAAALTVSDADDGWQVGHLLDQMGGPVAPVTADGAFDRDDAYAAVGGRRPDAPVVVPPRAGAVPSGAAEIAPPQRAWHIEAA